MMDVQCTNGPPTPGPPSCDSTEERDVEWTDARESLGQDSVDDIGSTPEGDEEEVFHSSSLLDPPLPPPMPPPIEPLLDLILPPNQMAPAAKASGVSDEEDQDYVMDYFGKISDQAEARLAARRQARAEARDIRMRELERQQKEDEQTADRVYDLYTEPPAIRSRASVAAQRSPAVLATPPTTYQSSRRSSEDSMEEAVSLRESRLGGGATPSLGAVPSGERSSFLALQQELKELEEKFKKAMFHNAQLDNEKSSFVYQVELLKDQIEQLEEAHSQLKREHKEKTREYDQLKRDSDKVKEDMEMYKCQLEERDRLILEKGLVIVGDDFVSSEEEESDEDEDSESTQSKKSTTKRLHKALVSIESAQLLETVGEGSLDVRLRKFTEERNELQDQVRHLKLELEEERSRHSKADRRASGSLFSLNGPDGPDIAEVNREATKQLGDYKFRLQKAEQDMSTLQANVARLESQVIRYKAAAESSEKAEDELKTEKRKMQRELREAQVRVEELETSNNHLVRRLDKLKNAKSTLLKEL